MPLTFSRGLSGNSAVIMGASEDAGNYSVGVGAELYSNYFIDLKYIDFFGDYSKNPDGSMNIFTSKYFCISGKVNLFMVPMYRIFEVLDPSLITEIVNLFSSFMMT